MEGIWRESKIPNLILRVKSVSFEDTKSVWFVFDVDLVFKYIVSVKIFFMKKKESEVLLIDERVQLIFPW
jgi:hypothetical protein